MNCVTLESPHLAVTINPDSGARIESFIDTSSGEEWLFDSGRSVGPGPFALYSDGPRKGFDECLPSVAACQHPRSTLSEGRIHDHGNIWDTQWVVVQASASTLVALVDVPGSPLRLTRTIELAADSADMDVTYELRNVSDFTYSYLYSAHPLIRFRGDTYIQLPEGAEVVAGFGPELAPGHQSAWPFATKTTGVEARIDRVSESGHPENYKVFVRSTGRCSLLMRHATKQLAVTQDHQALPWTGICVNREAWPTHEADESWIAVEPTTSPTDSLAAADAAREAMTLAPRQRSRWRIGVELTQSDPELRSLIFEQEFA